jgi:hypothetical protein
MSYNRENFLKRVVEIQDIVLRYKAQGVSQVTIYQRYIREVYHISYSCFNNYLTIPAKGELKKLQMRNAKGGSRETTS